jgi:hypothetical protein
VTRLALVDRYAVAGHCAAADRYVVADHSAAVDHSAVGDHGAPVARNVEPQSVAVDRYAAADRYVAADRCAVGDHDAPAARNVVPQNAAVLSEARNAPVARIARVAPHVVRRAVLACFQEKTLVLAPRCEAPEHCAACSRSPADCVLVSQLLPA